MSFESFESVRTTSIPPVYTCNFLELCAFAPRSHRHVAEAGLGPSRVADSRHHAEMQMDLVSAKVKFMIKEKRMRN